MRETLTCALWLTSHKEHRLNKNLFAETLKQAGALPQDKCLRSMYVPRLYNQHFEALKVTLADVPVSTTVEETTNVRDTMSWAVF